MWTQTVVTGCLTIALLAAMAVLPMGGGENARASYFDDYQRIYWECTPAWCWTGMWNFTGNYWVGGGWAEPGAWYVEYSIQSATWYGIYIYDDSAGKWDEAFTIYNEDW